jgi:hypothetical protein
VVSDLEVAILNAKDDIKAAKEGFPPNSRMTCIATSDLLVLIKAAKEQLKKGK